MDHRHLCSWIPASIGTTSSNVRLGTHLAGGSGSNSRLGWWSWHGCGLEQNVHALRYSKPAWAWPWGTSSSWHYFEKGGRTTWPPFSFSASELICPVFWQNQSQWGNLQGSIREMTRSWNWLSFPLSASSILEVSTRLGDCQGLQAPGWGHTLFIVFLGCFSRGGQNYVEV